MRGDLLEHVLEHGNGEPPRVGVVAAAVIAVEEPRAAREGVLGAVAEHVAAQREPERAQGGVMRDPAER